MRQAGLLDASNSDGCCVSDVWISAEKQFAFVEVRTVGDANNAMQLDGITLYGQPLRINRPSDYVPPPPGGGDPQAALAAHQQAQAARLAAGIGPGMNMPGMHGAMNPIGGMLPMPGMPAPGFPGMMPPANLKHDLMQRTKKCRRVHIGNLPMNVGLTPDALKSFVNTVAPCPVLPSPRAPCPLPPAPCPLPPRGRPAPLHFFPVQHARGCGRAPVSRVSRASRA